MDCDRAPGRRYRLVLHGEPGEPFGDLFEGMQMRRLAGTMVLTGMVADQAHLHGLIRRSRELELELVSLEPADESVDGRWSRVIRQQAAVSGSVYLTCRACGHLHEAEALRQSPYIGQQPVADVQTGARSGLGRRLARRAVTRQLTRDLRGR